MTHYYDREETAPVRLGNFMGVVDQLIAILDFCSRNDMPLQSCDYDLDTSIDNDEKKRWAAQCGADPQTYMSYFSMVSRPHYHLPRAHLVEEQWTQIYGARGNELGYNVGATISELDGLPTLTVGDEKQHLASYWVALEQGKPVKLQVLVDWPDGRRSRAPIYLQGENYEQICAVTGTSSDVIDGRAAPLPAKIRLVVHPRQPGTYALPRAVEIVAMPLSETRADTERPV